MVQLAAGHTQSVPGYEQSRLGLLITQSPLLQAAGSHDQGPASTSYLLEQLTHTGIDQMPQPHTTQGADIPKQPRQATSPQAQQHTSQLARPVTLVPDAHVRLPPEADWKPNGSACSRSRVSQLDVPATITNAPRSS